MAFASGKVLLFGEHAVVHGEPAIAAGLDRGVVATRHDADELRLVVPAWDLDVRAGDGSRVGRAIEALAGALPAEARRGRFEVSPSIPPGAGLGSSAALAVAVARAALSVANDLADEELVAAAALASERVFHGNPSGLDHTVAMRGGLIRFRRGTPPIVDPLSAAETLSLVVAPVEPGADTGAMVRGVARRVDHHPGLELLAAIGRVVDRAAACIRDGDIEAVGELMDINHGLLAALGVSTPGLDAACHRARNAGALGAKLTGAGGGGAIVALAAAEGADEIAAALGPGAFVATVAGGNHHG